MRAPVEFRVANACLCGFKWMDSRNPEVCPDAANHDPANYEGDG